VNQGRCDMYPTCSQYCILSIHKHGPAIGIMMTADRIIHEGGEQDYVRRIRVGTRYRFYDPVEHNDFWWYDK
jgi:putative component of membrane protein insertase Oxa1/YidC/SpoIIIJ protein YidD